MTTPAPDLTGEQRRRLDAIEAAPAAPESLRTRLLVATHAAACNCGEEDPTWSSYWNSIADAALAVVRGES